MFFDDIIIGSDEVGTGALAGPIIVCAVAVPTNWKPPRGLRDSKKLSHNVRKRLSDELVVSVPVYRTVVYESQAVDTLGLQLALMRAHQEAIQLAGWAVLPSCGDKCRIKIIIDGNQNPYKYLKLPEPFDAKVLTIPRADDTVPAVSAASIIAKVMRDEMMIEHAKLNPGFSFEQNKGYLSEVHRRALFTLGPCPIHRQSYAPVRSALRMSEKKTRSIRRFDVR